MGPLHIIQPEYESKLMSLIDLNFEHCARNVSYIRQYLILLSDVHHQLEALIIAHYASLTIPIYEIKPPITLLVSIQNWTRHVTQGCTMSCPCRNSKIHREANFIPRAFLMYCKRNRHLLHLACSVLHRNSSFGSH
jgi:hypothetical protein